jgi:hypothetical protein
MGDQIILVWSEKAALLDVSIEHALAINNKLQQPPCTLKDGF